MKRGQADRSVIAARASRSTRQAIQTVGTNPALRREALPTMTGPARKTRCAPMTRAQKSGDESGRTSLWAASPYYRDAVGNDPRWSR